MKRLRLTWVATHPSQYLAPFLRHLTVSCPELDVTALYATLPSAAQHGVDFGREVHWGVPLTEDYAIRVMRPAHGDDQFTYERFRGVDAPGITRVLRDLQPDLVLVPGWHSIYLLRALFAARRIGVPVLYRGDSHLGSSGVGLKRHLAHARARILLRQFTSGLAVGSRARAYLQALGMSEDRVFDVPHCVDNSFFDAIAQQWRADGRGALRQSLGLGHNDFVVMFVGKVAEHKRVSDLIAAVARTPSPVTLLIAGSGPDEQRCRAAATQAGIRAVFAGFMDQRELVKAYAAADCLALPSRETWGLVCNEALACGLPLVVSDAVGSAPDLVTPGVTGEVFPHGDVEALAAAIRRVRHLVETDPALADRCRARASAHSFEVATAGLVRACKETLAAVGRVDPPRVIAPLEKNVLLGGNELSLFEVFDQLRVWGGTVHCLVNRWDSTRIRLQAVAHGATWSYGRHAYPVRRRAQNPWRWLRMGWETIKCSMDVMRVVRARRATHIIYGDFVAVLLHAWANVWLRLRGVRIIFKVPNAVDEGRFYRLLWKWAVIPLVDVAVANSQYTADSIAQTGASENKIRWSYQPVLARQRAIAPRDPNRIIYVGQILPQKGVGVLLDALALLRERGIPATLDIVGDLTTWLPPDLLAFREEIQARAARPPLAGAVRLLGWRTDVLDLIAVSAVHCCPSLPAIREAYGRVVVEAKTTATPSVVFPTGALSEVVTHEVNGWICAEVSAAHLAEGLAYYLTDPARAAEHGAAALADLSRFSESVWRNQWMSIVGVETTEPVVGVSPRSIVKS